MRTQGEVGAPGELVIENRRSFHDKWSVQVDKHADETLFVAQTTYSHCEMDVEPGFDLIDRLNEAGRQFLEYEVADEGARCPACGSVSVSGEMLSFMVPLDHKDGTPDGEWNDWESNTELGEKRYCSDCDEEWEH